MADRAPFPCHPIPVVAARLEAEAAAATARQAVLPDLRRILAAELGIAAEGIAPTDRLDDDLAMDELDGITVAMAIEQHWDIAVADDAWKVSATVAEVADVIAGLIAAKVPPA